MKIAIMQPYFLPYIGYFQLMNAVDEFIVYDNIEYTKKGWINRNRILVNGKDSQITIPLKKDSDFLHVRERFLADSWKDDKKKMLNKIKEAYRKAPHFNEAYAVVENIILYNESNLFKFIVNSIEQIKGYLEIKTPIVISSSIPCGCDLKAEKKVLAICKAKKADAYINPIGGTELYNKDEFKCECINLNFLKSGDIKYKQFDNDFIPWLSIIDVMMFNSKQEIRRMLDSYTLV